jgi:crotonobetainyl-CoA:carnitine CoA-transferase CaiB-like acyl-CoA transferase
VSYEQPYAGLKVIDLSQGVAGPYCAMLLAQYGAEVIKVEPPEGGDWSRTIGVTYGDQTAYSIPSNLGKRSIALDLKSQDGRQVLWRLLAGADVFIQGFRPGVIERLGFGYPVVSEREPRIIYLSISGFGPAGPLAERPAMDPVLQAFTGLLAENVGEDGVPHRTPIIAIDMSTALYAFVALAPALYARRNESRGRLIEASLLQSAAGLQVVRMMQRHLESEALRPPAGPTGVYKAADGWISITVPRQHEWLAFCAAMDLPGLAENPQFATIDDRAKHAAEMRELLRPVFAKGSVAHWSGRLAAHKVMHERLNQYADFLAHPHTVASNAVAWIDHPGVPHSVPLPNLPGLPAFTANGRSTAPALGEHSVEILQTHGFTQREIADLAERSVIRTAAS